MVKFCVNCKQKIPEGFGTMFNDEKPVQFEDGTYCYNCAKLKVDRSRR